MIRAILCLAVVTVMMTLGTALCEVALLAMDHALECVFPSLSS